jgi:hypothetical protein
MTIMKFSAIFVFSLFSIFQSIGQHTNFNTQRNWSLNKKDILLGFGATQFTGDLGGRNRIGTDYSLADIDFPATSFNFMLGYRYRFHPFFATTTVLNIGRVKGDDALTNEVIRESRNLHFRSFLLEFSQRLDIILYVNEKFGARYNLPGHQVAKNHNEQLYLFAGVGGCYFNPEAMWNNKWYKLDPLNTEGQGIKDGARETLPISLTIPMGIGFRIGFGRMWRLGIEASYVKTFTDYIDDVSSVYFDPSKLESPEAQHFSNPSVNNANWFSPGQQRGDSQKDAYYYLNLVIARNLTYKDYAKQRQSYKYPKSRYKY